MQTIFRGASILLAPFVIAALAACGGGGYNAPSGPTDPGDPTPVRDATVQATPAEQFTPGRINLIVGGTVADHHRLGRQAVLACDLAAQLGGGGVRIAVDRRGPGGGQHSRRGAVRVHVDAEVDHLLGALADAGDPPRES